MLALFFKLLPFLVALYAGIYSILEVLFPSLRSPNFNRWEADVRVGPYVNIMGWTKVLTPPRVLAYRYMSNSAACAVAVAAVGEQVLGAQKTRASTVEAVAVNVNWD